MPRRDEDIAALSMRLMVFGGIIALFMGLVAVRLFYLQVLHGSSYQEISEHISIREEEIPARRGVIYDRRMNVLADNRPYLEVTAVPQYMGDKKQVLATLGQLIDEDPNVLEETLNKDRSPLPFMPTVLLEDVSYDKVAKIREFDRPNWDEEINQSLQGIYVRAEPLRVYLYPELFSHALGYLREIDKTLLEKKQQSDPSIYALGDWIGSSGLEEIYDADLKGIDGIKARVVDARGREVNTNSPEVKTLAERASHAPVDGLHLMTTLDLKAQLAAAEAMRGRKGAVVALDPNNGEVIALYSAPGYDGNRIMKHLDKAYWQKINLDNDKYLFNRATQASFPPGSTYKIVTALAGLDTKKITSDTHYGCGGGMQFGNRFFQCWNKAGHGSVEIIRAIMQSCDVFFYNVGIKVGVDGLSHYAHQLGLGEKTGIDLPNEKSGLIPSTDWKQKRYGKPWIDSETLSISIGQGYDLVTPLQNARMISMIANGGHLITPHVGKALLGADKQPVRQIETPLLPSVLSDEELKPIREGLIGVVQGQGTAGRLKASRYKIAGKTGTAQVIGYDSKLQKNKDTNDHAWFVCYAPYDHPQIAMAVLVENGGHGGAEAAPVAQAVIDTYLDEENAHD